MIGPARVAAYEILKSVDEGRSDLPSAIAHARTTLADDRDQALAAEIATGVERWRAALDHVVAAAAGRPLRRLDPEVLRILRLSAYQLLHLTRVPAAAAVDDAVDLTRRVGKRSAAGFVNAVLRALTRARHRLPLPVRPEPPYGRRDEALAYLSITLSHPEWLAARWLDRLGFEAAEARLTFNNQAAPLTLRANRLRVTRDALADHLEREDVITRPTVFAPDGLVVESGHPLRGEGYAQGWFVVQDEASQLVATLAADRARGRVLDACASPGGKTTAVAAALGSTGLVVACDVRDRRMALLVRTLAACGADRVRLVQASLLEHPPFTIRFDTVIVDVPCSGLGTLRRDPDIRWRRHEADLAAFADAERRMLARAAEAVAPGGTLIYATCSSEPEENDGVVRGFLNTAGDYSIVDVRQSPGRLSPDVLDTDGFLRTTPERHGLECFFAAVLTRRG